MLTTTYPPHPFPHIFCKKTLPNWHFLTLFPLEWRNDNWNSGTNVRWNRRKALICDIVKFYNLTPCVNLLHHPPISRLGDWVHVAQHRIFFQRSFERLHDVQQTQSNRCKLTFFVILHETRMGRGHTDMIFKHFTLPHKSALCIEFSWVSLSSILLGWIEHWNYYETI